MQNRLADGNICQTLTTSPSTPGVFDVLLPLSGVDQFGFTVSSSTEMKSPYMNIKIAGSDVTIVVLRISKQHPMLNSHKRN